MSNNYIYFDNKYRELEKVKLEEKLMRYVVSNEDKTIYAICGMNLDDNNNAGLKSMLELLKCEMIDKNVLICVITYNKLMMITKPLTVTEDFILTIENYMMNYFGVIGNSNEYDLNGLKQDILEYYDEFKQLKQYKLKLYVIS